MTERLVPETDFPILAQRIGNRRLVYLDSAATSQKPRVVLDRIHQFYTTENGNIHRGTHTLSQRASASYERARNTVADFIGAACDREIVFTGGTTDSINLLSATYGESTVGEGDEVLVTEMEHHSNLVPWQQLCLRKGATLRIVPFNNEGMLDMDAYERLLGDRTRLVAVVYVSNALGTVNPVRDIIELAHHRRVPVMLDAAQAVQHMPIDVQELDCDFLVFSGHKLYAETGIGVLYAKQRLLEEMPPYRVGGGMIESVSTAKTTWGEIPTRFEAGTPNIAAAVSLDAAITYLQSIGMEQIGMYEDRLYRYALSRLGQIDGITIYGKGESLCGSISFNLEGIHPYDAGTILDRMGVAIRTGTHCAEPAMARLGVLGTARVSFGLYNTRDDVDKLVEGLGRVERMLGSP